MTPNLPQWYRIAAIENINEDTLEKRSLAIEAIINGESDEDFYFNCVRLYLGKKISDREFTKQFFTAFNGKDALYLEDTPLLETRILAGAIIAQWFSDTVEFGDKLAYTLLCGSFGLSDVELINKDIITSAQNYLRDRAEQERISTPVTAKIPTWKDETPTVETMGTYMKSVATYVKNMAVYNDKQLKISQKRIDRLQEESDIHWWLFRSFSNIHGMPIAELPSDSAPFVLAYELIKLIAIVPAPGNTNSFLNKSLKEITNLPLNYTVKQAAEILFTLKTEFEDILKNDKFGNLTPLTYAVCQLTEANGDDAWLAIFKLNSKIDADFTCSTQEMALQLFNELMLLSIQ